MARPGGGVCGGVHAAPRHHGSQRRAAEHRQGAAHLLHRSAVGRGRVRAHPRGDAAERRFAGRHTGAQARLPRRNRPLHAGFGTLRGGHLPALADPCARGTGDRRRRNVRGLARDHLAGVLRPRGRAFGIWGATVGAAVAIGPLVGGALTTYVGWRWIFFVNVPIGVACVAVGMRVLHETRDEQAGRFDLAGLLTLTGGLFALVLGLLRGADWGWSSGRVVGLFAAAAVLLVSFAFVELRRESPMLDIRLFRVPTFTGAQITAFAISSGMFAQFLFLPLYLESVLGYSAV